MNRRQNQGAVTIIGRKSNKLAEFDGNSDFYRTNRGGVVLVNDNSESRRVVEQCYKRHKTSVNPIVEWTDKDVWQFIRSESVPYCELYDEGWKRLGCIGCPMASTNAREREFLRWPKYKAAYLRAFDKMLEHRRKRHELDPTKPLWKVGGTAVEEATALAVFNWWMEYDLLPGQVGMFDDYDGEAYGDLEEDE